MSTEQHVVKGTEPLSALATQTLFNPFVPEGSYTDSTPCNLLSELQ